jgi:hypothetical protein
LKTQIGKNVEAYVDDVVVKTTEEDKLVMTNNYVAIMIAALGKLPSTLATSSLDASSQK